MRYERIMEWCNGRWLRTTETIKQGFVFDENDLADLASGWANMEVIRDTAGGYIVVAPKMSSGQIQSAHRFSTLEAAAAAALTTGET